MTARRDRSGRRGGGDGTADPAAARAAPQRDHRAAGNGHKVLDSLFDRPIVAVNDVRKMTGYARNRRFHYAPYIALFNEAGPESGAAEASARA